MSEERKAAERLIFRGIGLVAVIVLAAWLLPQVWDKLSPFIIAIPMAAMLQPIIRFLQKHLKMKRGLASLILELILLALIIGLMVWVLSLLVEQVTQFIGQFKSLLTEAIKVIQEASDRLIAGLSSDISGENGNSEIVEAVRNAWKGTIENLTNWGTETAVPYVTNRAVAIVTGLPYGIIYFSFLAMALFFITKDYPDIRSYLPGGKRYKQDSKPTQLTNSAIKSLMGYLRVQGTFSLMVFGLSYIVLKILGFQYAGAIALIAGIMELIPMIGSGLLYIVLGIIFFLTGNTAGGFQVLILTAALQLIRRLLEPKLMSDSIGITPLQSLIGMFVGMRFGGILGLIGGPVLMSVLVGAVHGQVFKAMMDDIHCLVAYFRRRWARAPEEIKDTLPETLSPPSDPPQAIKKETPKSKRLIMRKSRNGKKRQGR